MSEDYDRALEAVRQLHSLGATRVSVGPIQAEFPPRAPKLFDLDGQEVHPDLEEEETRKLDRATWEQEQYFSAGPAPRRHNR